MKFIWFFVGLFFLHVVLFADIYQLDNNKLELKVHIKNKKLASFEVIQKEKGYKLCSDGNFALDFVWNDWSAPGKIHNADVNIVLKAEDFDFVKKENRNINGEKILDLYFQSNWRWYYPLKIRVSYKLSSNEAFYFQKQISVMAPKEGGNFLRKVYVINEKIKVDDKKVNVLKEGGFGEPIAFIIDNSWGVFSGMEVATATNKFKRVCDKYVIIKEFNYVGKEIGNQWYKSDWAVVGLTPNRYVRNWFDKYLDYVRVAPLKPYTLYNSWYDVRSAIYVKDTNDIMNEKNLFRIISDFKREMIDKNNIKLDAFVLDDGWDIYESDWELRKKEFPNGLLPIAEKAEKELGSTLGIWFGPTGGYSFRDKRIDWMKNHGYEVTKNRMLCLAGKNYSKLFTKRVVDFVKNDKVGYFKWDGIQFSCSDPTHGHPVGIYSRNAVFNSLAAICDTVRKLNPDIFLNITSGTWLSPWWTKLANTIWMQGGDYGWSDVPSISKRDAAITYRDMVLYEDFGINKSWFPIANLMTHGIIKGHLQKLGGEAEPLDKFTDNAILYFARGVTMYEIYISPNLLTNDEWYAISQSLKWARENFDILKNTRRIGGNPNNREPYGYVHFNGSDGIIALRNPFILEKNFEVKLLPEYGIDSTAKSLVVEQIYPKRMILPDFYSAGSVVSFNLSGYETAIYKIYPVDNAKVPLVSGVYFDDRLENGVYSIDVFGAVDEVKVLNAYKFNNVKIPEVSKIDTTIYNNFKLIKKSKNKIKFSCNLLADSAQFAFLYENSDSKALPKFTLKVNGKKVKYGSSQQKNKWEWLLYNLNKGNNVIEVQISKNPSKEFSFNGWLIGYKKLDKSSIEVRTDLKKLPELPPVPYKKNVVRFIEQLF